MLLCNMLATHREIMKGQESAYLYMSMVITRGGCGVIEQNMTPIVLFLPFPLTIPQKKPR